MKTELLLKIVKTAWPVIAAIVSMLLPATWYAAKMDDQIHNMIDAANTEHESMKAYVDYGNKTINVRIDDMNNDISGLHNEIISSNERVDNTMNQIMEMQKESNDHIEKMNEESNERLDQLILIINSRYKR